jgi:nucleoid DNA-binding protein
MRDRKERELIKQVAAELKLSPQQVIDVVESVLDYVRLLFTKGKYEGVQIPYLGKFWVKAVRLVRVKAREVILEASGKRKGRRMLNLDDLKCLKN